MYLSKKSSERVSQPESSDNEYMPLKPTQYMLENPMDKHGHGYMHPESSEEAPDISMLTLFFLTSFVHIGLRDALNKNQKAAKLLDQDEDLVNMQDSESDITLKESINFTAKQRKSV